MKEDKEDLVKAISQVGKFFPDVPGICENGYFKMTTEELDETDNINRCIKLYCLIKGIPIIQTRRAEVMYYYLKYGYSRQTKDFIMKKININDSNLNNINNALRNIGFIKQVGYNNRNNEVNAELLAFKNYMDKGSGAHILIAVE